MKVGGRSTGRYDEHKDKTNPSNQILSKTSAFSLQFVSFIEKRKVEWLGRRDASEERSS